jgi:non-ribosomal peptide synthetase component F
MGIPAVHLARGGSLTGAGWREILLPRDASLPGSKVSVDEGTPTRDVAVVSTALSDDAARAFDTLSAADPGRLSSIVTAAWALVMSRLTGESGVRVIGSRGDLADLESEAAVAALVDTARVALLDVAGSEVFDSWLARVTLDEQELIAFQDSELSCSIPLDSQHAASRSILLSVGLNAGRDALASRVNSAASWSGFPLTLMVGFGSSIEIHLGYDSRIEAAMAKDLLDYLSVALESVARDPQQRLDEIPLLDASRRELMLERWNDTGVDY